MPCVLWRWRAVNLFANVEPQLLASFPAAVAGGGAPKLYGQGILSCCVLVPAGKKAAGAYALSIQGEPMQYVEDLMEDNGVHRGR